MFLKLNRPVKVLPEEAILIVMGKWDVQRRRIDEVERYPPENQEGKPSARQSEVLGGYRYSA